LKCEICGKEINASSYSNAVLCSIKCFHTHFWREIIAEKEKHIIIHGNCYCDGGNIENPRSTAFVGFSGRRFWIRFFDGHEITTNNLWTQGEIPEEFREQLPDNAEFFWPETKNLIQQNY
jgi:hypothetical protein